MRTFLVFAFAAAMVLSLALGCSDEAPVPTSTQAQESSGLYGLDNSREEPGFGLMELPGMTEDPEFICPTSPATGGDPMISDSYADVYSVRILWGNLFNDQNETNLTTDWSGSLQLNARGMVVLRRTVDFEPGQDSILPTEAAHFVRWASTTIQPDFDGIHVEVYRPAHDSSVYFAPPAIIFHTEPITIVLQMVELVELDTVITVDEYNSVSIQARKVTTNCPQGFLAGHWLQKAYTAGYFFGRWMSIDGKLMGHYKGEFWTDSDGNRVFEGKWIDSEGWFQGFLKGTWGYNNNVVSADVARLHGWFRGTFTDAGGNIKGGLKGRFGCNCTDCTSVNARPNMDGVWWVYCPSVSIQ